MHSPAAAHCLAVLGYLARQVEPIPAARIAARLGLPRSTTYRLLATLVSSGYAVHVPEAGYALGLAAYELGSAYARQQPLQRAARPLIARLVERTGESAHLAVLSGSDALYLIEERAPGRPSLVSDVGVRLPAEVTASGLAMLAHLPGRQISALYPSTAFLVRRTESGPRTIAALRRRLGEIRRRGHSRETDSVTVGLSSLAMPVRDVSGRPIASVAVTFPTGSSETGVLEAIEATVAALRRRLGHAGETRSGQSPVAASSSAR